MATTLVYTYPELADRVAQELGIRPSLSSLRAAASDERRTGPRSGMPRVTSGMPAPLRRTSPTAPAGFSQVKVDEWLRRHPRRRYAAAVEALAAASGGTARQVEASVRRARKKGVSWRDVAAALTEGSPTPVSRVQAYWRFHHLDADGDQV